MAFQTSFNSVGQARMSPVANWAMVQLGITDLDSNNDVRQINEFLKSNEDPYTRQIRLANEQNTDLRNQLSTLAIDNEKALKDMADANAATIESILVKNRTDMDAMTNKFNDTLNRQNSAWETRYGDLQGELNTISQAYDAQTRMMGNLSRASTPSANASAEVPTLGDNRNNPARRAENNNLSSLAILTGLGTAGNPMSGLQLA